MKKSLLLSLSLALSLSAMADKLTVLTVEGGVPGVEEPQLMGLGISPDGRYVCGPIENGVGIFATDVESGVVRWSVSGDDGGELRHIDNNGLAIGFSDTGITYSAITGEETIIPAPEGYRYILAEALSNDGSVKVGSLIGDTFDTIAAYCDDGENWTPLPIPSQEELGLFAEKLSPGSAAKYVSGDGNVIFGYLGSFTIPIIWKRNADGKFEADFFPARYVKIAPEDADDDSKPLYSVSAMYLNLSNNGKYASMVGLISTGKENEYFSVPAIYQVESGKMRLYTDYQSIDEEGLGLYPTAICDNGSFIGTIGQPFFMSAGTFVMKAGQEEAEKLVDAYPAYAEKFGEGDSYGFNMPTGMSADGKYLLGYIFHCEDYNDAAADAYYVTYVLETDLDSYSKVENVEQAVDAVPEAIYSLDGRRLSTPQKGVNIIRMSDGSVRKEIR